MLKTTLMLLLMTVAMPVLACSSNEYEQCYSACLLPRPFGGCAQEVKDCKCFPKVGGVTGQLGEESKRAVNNIARELGKTPEAIQACMSNVQMCANEILAAPLALTVQAYIDGLYRQAEGRVLPFSHEFIALAQPYFSVDLRGITWADDINTGTGMSVSYCDRIFFVDHGKNLWKDKNELHHVLHELEHTVQCQRRGRRTYLAEYVLKAGVDVLKTGRFNVHDIHDFEVAAEAKADRLTPALWAQIQSGAVALPARERGPQMVTRPPMPVVTSCVQGEVYMAVMGGACCTSNYSRCRNLTTGVITCGAFGC